MKAKLLTVMALLTIVTLPAMAQSSTEAAKGQSEAKSAINPDKSDRPSPSRVKRAEDFVPMAAISNMFEIQSSNLAVQKSQNDAVKAFATKIGEDHFTVAANLNNAVDQSETQIPVPIDLDAAHEGMLRKLEASQQQGFDKIYVQMQMKAHKDTIALFEAFTKNGADGPLKDFASQTLLILKGHLQMIKISASSLCRDPRCLLSALVNRLVINDAFYFGWR